MNNTIDQETNFITINNLALQYELPKNTPINTHEGAKYLEKIEQIDVLPFDKATIRFSDDKWCFREYSSLNINKTILTLRFMSCPSNYKRLLKQYALVKLISNKIKIQTLAGHLYTLSKFLSFLVDNSIMNIDEVTVTILNDFIMTLIQKKHSLAIIHKNRNIIYSLFIFYESNIGNILTPELETFLTIKDIENYNSYYEENKAAEVPDEYYDKLLVALITYMNDESKPYWHRATAAVYIILSQIGLRINELLFIKQNSISYRELFTGERAYYLNYESWKGYAGNNTRVKCFTYINELSKSAYDFLVNLPEYKERRMNWNTNLLYCGCRYTQINNLPISDCRFRDHAMALMIELDRANLIKTINLNKEDYPYLHVYNTTPHQKKHGIATVSFPTTQQFRFHVCNELFKKGVALTYIQRFMNHLSRMITVYHLYRDNKVQEDMDESKRVLRGIVTGDEKIIEQDKGLKAKIDEFIKANNFNVEKDLETIVSKLAENIPIRVKVGGVCIKSSKFRDCSTDAVTNEFFCCYGVCPNLFHFFYHAGITFRKCKELKEALDINQKRGLLKQVYKDTNNLKNIITTQLLPQMDELEVQIKKHGAVYVSQTYPDLIEVIEHFNTIKEEAQKWVKTIQQI